MRSAVAWALVFSFLLGTTAVHPPSVSAADCEFVLGFKSIHDAIPDIVGDCIAVEHFNVENGDSLQETTGTRTDGGYGGLLVWRKADNWTAYSDGYRTWVNGPNGLQQRLNSERFEWEADTPPASASSTPAATGPIPSQPTPTPNPQAPAQLPTTEQRIVTPGAWCSPSGATGVTSKGLPMVCTYLPGEDRARWRSP